MASLSSISSLNATRRETSHQQQKSATTTSAQQQQQSLPPIVAAAVSLVASPPSQHNKGGSGKSRACCGLTIRALVSKKKLRFVENGVDLDLSYITDRIVAMGYPSVGAEAFYRNPAGAVRQFLEKRHAGHYRIWNLCIERGYGAAALGLKCEVERYSWYDHTPPPLSLMRPCCDSMHAWLAADRENITVVHCKAGKGRTGTIIAASLVHEAGVAAAAGERTSTMTMRRRRRRNEDDEDSEEEEGQEMSSRRNGSRVTKHTFRSTVSAQEALDAFGWRRTRNGRGVTIPGQMRYVKYYALQVAAEGEARVGWPNPLVEEEQEEAVAMVRRNDDETEGEGEGEVQRDAEKTLGGMSVLQTQAAAAAAAASASITAVDDVVKTEQQPSIFSAGASVTIPATATIISTIPDEDEPSAYLLTIVVHRDSTRALGFSLAPDLEGRVVVIGFKTYHSSKPKEEAATTTKTKTKTKEVEKTATITGSSDSTTTRKPKITRKLLDVDENTVTELERPSSSQSLNLLPTMHHDGDIGEMEKMGEPEALVEKNDDNEDDDDKNVHDDETQEDYHEKHQSTPTKKEAATIMAVSSILQLGDEIRAVNGSSVVLLDHQYTQQSQQQQQLGTAFHFSSVLNVLRGASDPLTLVIFRRPELSLLGHSQSSSSVSLRLPPSTPSEYLDRVARGIGPWAAGSDARILPSPPVQILSVSLSHAPRMPRKGGSCGKCMRAVCDSDNEHDDVRHLADVLSRLYVQVYAGPHCRTIVYDSRNVEKFAGSAKGAGRGAVYSGSGGSGVVKDWGNKGVGKSPHTSTHHHHHHHHSHNTHSGAGKHENDDTKKKNDNDEEVVDEADIRAHSKNLGVASSSRGTSVSNNSDHLSRHPHSHHHHPHSVNAISRRRRRRRREKQGSGGENEQGSNSEIDDDKDKDSSDEVDSDDDSLWEEAVAPHTRKSPASTTTKTTSISSPVLHKTTSSSPSSPSSSPVASSSQGREGFVVQRFDPAAGPLSNAAITWGSAYFLQSSSSSSSSSSSAVCAESDGTQGPAKVTCTGDFRVVLKYAGRKKPLTALWLHSACLPLPIAVQELIAPQVERVQAAVAPIHNHSHEDKKERMHDLSHQQHNNSQHAASKSDSAEREIAVNPTPRPVLNLLRIAGGGVAGEDATRLASVVEEKQGEGKETETGDAVHALQHQQQQQQQQQYYSADTRNFDDEAQRGAITSALLPTADSVSDSVTSPGLLSPTIAAAALSSNSISSPSSYSYPSSPSQIRLERPETQLIIQDEDFKGTYLATGSNKQLDMSTSSSSPKQYQQQQQQQQEKESLVSRNGANAVFIANDVPGGLISVGCPTLGSLLTAAASSITSSISSTTTTTAAKSTPGTALSASGLPSFSTSSSFLATSRIANACVLSASFGKMELDGVIKDKKHRVWPENLKLALTFRFDPASVPHMLMTALEQGVGGSNA